MKLIHLSDLHLGKRVNEFSMIDDQKYILLKIINIIDSQNPDGVIIAGDVYDKSVPSAEAVELFDDFLVKLSKRNLKVFIISGNHDSPERIAFGSRLFNQSGVYMSPVYDGKIEPITLNDSYGNVNIYMLPFLKPAHVRRYFEGEISTYTQAIKVAIDNMKINQDERNVIVTHQFVTGALRSDSEEISIGGTDNVEITVFDKFDYVALGHIHRPQKIIRDTVRYCGTPLKYSFSEANHKKSVTVVELKEKGTIEISAIPLVPKLDMCEIKGTYMEVTDKSFYDETNTNDYMHITLTDEEDIPDVVSKLRVIYPNIMKIDYDNKRTRQSGEITATQSVENKTPQELFNELYKKQNNTDMSDCQMEFVSDLLEKICNEN